MRASVFDSVWLSTEIVCAQPYGRFCIFPDTRADDFFSENPPCHQQKNDERITTTAPILTNTNKIRCRVLRSITMASL